MCWAGKSDKTGRRITQHQVRRRNEFVRRLARIVVIDGDEVVRAILGIWGAIACKGRFRCRGCGRKGRAIVSITGGHRVSNG
jgi:hypothetical protein